jgi:hypothetical protein
MEIDTMRTNSKSRLPRGWFALLLLAAATAFAAGTMMQGARRADAEVRKTATPKAFESGGERSEAVLKEILVVLKTMDRRLEHFEQVLDQAAQE